MQNKISYKLSRQSMTEIHDIREELSAMEDFDDIEVVEIDLEDVSLPDSSFLGQLLYIHRMLKNRGISLHIVNVNRLTQTVLRTSCLDRILTIPQS